MEKRLESTWRHFLFLERSKPPSGESLELLDAFLGSALMFQETGGQVVAGQQPPGMKESLDLSRVWMKELRNLCLHCETVKDHLPLKDFLLRGRGWKILALLDRNAKLNPGSLWWSMEFVDLLINIFQLLLETGEESSTSCNESDQNTIRRLLPSEPSNFREVIDLWNYVKSRYNVEKRKKCNRKSYKRKPYKQGKIASSSPLGFSEMKLIKKKIFGTNLQKFEESLEESSDSSYGAPQRTTVEVQAFPSNPLDFEYFEREMRSEDEARFLIDWRIQREIVGAKVEETEKNTTEEDVRRLSALRITNGQCCKLVLSLLTTLCGAEVKQRKLRASYELSLKLIGFASDALFQLDKETRVTTLSELEKINIHLLLLQLLQVALSEMQFHQDYMVILQNNSVINLCLATLTRLLACCESSDMPQLYAATTLQLATSTLHIIDSFQTFSESVFRRKDKEGKKTMSVFEWLCAENGVTVIDKVFSLILTFKGETELHEDIILLYREMTSCLASAEKCKKNMSAKATKSISSLYSISIRSVLDLVKKDKSPYLIPVPEEIIICVAKNNKNSLANLVGPIIDALLLSPVQSIFANIIWDQMLSAIIQPNIFQSVPVLTAKIFSLIEHIVNQDFISAARLNSNTASTMVSKRPAFFSDSDSTFYPSDASVERCNEHQVLNRIATSPAKQYGSLLRKYVELLQLEGLHIQQATINHLIRLIEKSPWQLRYHLFTQVIVPLLEKTTPFSMSEGKCNVIQKCLATIPALLTNKELLNFFHHHKVFKSVISFKSISGLIEVSYGAISAYLSSEISFILNSPVFDKLTAFGADTAESSSEEAAEHSLTEEDAFQPDFMKALSLTTIVKEFHEILLSRTARVLDSSTDDICMLELLCVWRTQRDLVNQFIEYQDYAQSKGISRIIEDLFISLVNKLLAPEIIPSFKTVISVLGYLIEILIQFDLTKSTHDESMSSFPSSCFDERKILEQNLRHLCSTTMKLNCSTMIRLVIRAVLDAAKKKEYSLKLELFPAVSNDIGDYENAGSNFDYEADESETGENIAHSKITRPDTGCEILNCQVIDFVLELAMKLLEAGHPHSNMIAEYVISSISQLCNRNDRNAVKLLENRFLTKLLNGVPMMMQKESLKLEVKKLISTLGKRTLERSELRSMLDLFKDDNFSGTKVVLESLREIAHSTSSALYPQYSVQFPIHLDPLQDSSPKTAKNLSFILPVGMSWFLNAQSNFSVGVWISFSCIKKCSKNYRIFSIGDKALYFEVLTDFTSITVRITNNDQQKATAVGTATFSFLKVFTLPWNHFIVTCRGKTSKTWEVQTIFNGFPSQRLFIAPKTWSTMEAPETFLIIGDQDTSNITDYTFQLASIMLFHRGIISDEAALLLFMMGPEEIDVTSTGEEPQLVMCKKDILQAFPQYNSKLCNNELFLSFTSLKESLFFSYKSERPMQVIVHRRPTEGESFLENLVQSKNLNMELPKAIHSAGSDCMEILCRIKFGRLVMQEGGMITLILLVARMVELESSDEELSVALDVVFFAMNSTSSTRRDWIVNDAVQLLHRILEDDKCRFGIHCAKTILDHSCTTPLLKFDDKEKSYVFVKSSNAIIHNPSAIVLLLHCWKSLEMELQPAMKRSLGCSSNLEVVLNAFCLLLRSDHLHSKLNIETFRQLLIAKMLVYKLVEAISYSQENHDCFGIGEYIVNIFAALIGSPPDSKVLRDIVTSILLAHDSKLSFVSHSKSSFYFNIGSKAGSNRNSRSSSESTGMQLEETNTIVTEGNVSNIIKNEEKQTTHSKASVLEKLGSVISEEKNNCKSISNEKDTVVINIQDVSKVKDQSQNSSSVLKNMFVKTNWSEKEIKRRAFETKNVRSETSIHQDIDNELKEDNTGQMHVDNSQQYNILEHPGPWGKTSFESEIGGTRYLSSLGRLISGLLDILFGALQNVSDADLPAIVNDIIFPEYLIVLCNNSSNEIREKSVRLLWQYIHRSNALESQGYRMQKINGYFLLANQLHRYVTTEGIVNACLSIVHNRDFHLEEIPEIPSYTQISVRSSGMIPLLAIMPNSVYDIALAHSLILHIHELFAKVPGMLQNMRSLGLFESLCKTLFALSQTRPGLTDVLGHDSRDIVFQDLHDFLRLISIRFVGVHGSDNFNSVLDLLHLLICLSQREGADNQITTVFSTAACIVIDECLSEIQTRLFQIDNPQIKPKQSLHVYGGFFPIEEMTDLLLRSKTPRGSVSSVDGLTGAGTFSSLKYSKDASRNELIERFSVLVDIAVEFLALVPEEIQCTDDLAAKLLSLLITELRHKWESTKLKTLFPNQQKLRKRLLTLVNQRLSPAFSLKRRLNVLKILNKQFRSVEMLSYLFENVQNHAQNFITLLEDLIVIHGEEMDEDDIQGCLQFYEFIPTCNSMRRMPPLEMDKASRTNSILLELDKLSIQACKNAKMFVERCETVVSRSSGKYRELSRSIAHLAVEVTKSVMRAQDEERKRFMSMIRAALADKVRVQQIWQELIARYTHERAIWHFSGKYPNSWSLSEVESSQRTRVRLERKFTGIAEKHYLQEHRYKSGETMDRPFKFLGHRPPNMSGVIVEQLNSNDSIRFMEKALLSIPDMEIGGELLISDTALHFVANTDETDSGQVIFIWRIETIREIHRRWYQLVDTAVEVFFSSSSTQFFVLDDRKQRNAFIKKLVEMQPKLSEQPDPDLVMKLWQDGEITNFDYLMQLNKLAGRSFNDLMQYPIFPFVLADYDSKILNLYSEGSFRNLRRPIAVQDRQQEKRFINNYNALADQLEKNAELQCPSVGPFHYGSHYSNSGIVLHFLVRIPPYTSMFLKYQDGNFDIPDRSFHDIGNTWKLASRESTTDVKELIPDLFCLPELLVNSEGFNFGTKQDDQVVNDVVLPPWAKNNPRLFIKIHRQALESSYVRDHLNHWIDLIFGYKQSGKEAVAAVNVFHPATYYGFDLSSIQDPIQRAARATMIKTYGQTPKQLFKKPHPMVTKNLVDMPLKTDPPKVPRVLNHIMGLKWGSFLGSPSQADPVVVWRGFQTTRIDSFEALANNEVYGIPEKSSLVIKYAQELAESIIKRTRIIAGAIVLTHFHPDGVVRAKIRKSTNPAPFFTTPNWDEISLVRAHPELNQLWMGFKSGKVEVQGFHFNPKELQLSVIHDATSLYDHSRDVNCLDLCPEFSIALTGSEDCTAILYDLNSLRYIRTLKFDGTVSHLKISKASGDLAIVSRESSASRLTLCSINGSMVGSERCESLITSLTVSSSTEGSCCNVIVTGHKHGLIKMWNSWNLAPLRDLSTLQESPVVALTFSFDNQNLYAATFEKEVIIFEKSDVIGVKNEPKFVNLTSI